MRDPRPLTWSIFATLSGGILIVLASVSAALVTRGWMAAQAMPFSPMMEWTLTMGLDASWLAGVGMLAGAAVLVAGVFIRARGDQAQLWGFVAIIGGTLSLLAMGGYLLGAVLAMMGGAMAIASGGARADMRATRRSDP